MNRTRRAALTALVVPALAACATGAPGTQEAKPADLSKATQKVLIWGPSGAADIPPRQAQAAVLTKQYPSLTTEVVVSPFTSAQGVEGLQKLFASVAAGDPPEVAWIDRFQLANLAVRKTVASIDAYAKRDKYDLKRHFNPLLEEVTGIDGKTFGLPSSTDNRSLWWNKRHLRESGVDGEKGPQTWDDLRQFAARATRASATEITQLGWNYKNPGFGILYLWSWIAGAEFFSKDGRTAQYNHPGVIAALDFLLAGADAQGGTAKVEAFLPTASAGGDPFVTERFIMYVAGSPLNAIARQRPDMDFGFGIVPVRRAGDKPQTFAGGFSWAVPFGTKNPDVSWAALRSLMSEEALAAYVEAAAGPARAGGGVYIPGFTTVQDLDKKFRQQYATGIKTIDAAWDFIIDQMKYARVRPVSPAAADAWDALSETWNNVLARKQTPKEACDAMNGKVQRSLNEAYGKK